MDDALVVVGTERGWEEVRAALAIIATLEQEWARALGARRMQQLRVLLDELAQVAGR